LGFEGREEEEENPEILTRGKRDARGYEWRRQQRVENRRK
jgi:hypothetical protein